MTQRDEIKYMSEFQQIILCKFTSNTKQDEIYDMTKITVPFNPQDCSEIYMGKT